MFKFVPTDVGALGGKRKSTQRACDECRRKKRRCHHDPLRKSPQLAGTDHPQYVPDGTLQASARASKGTTQNGARKLHDQPHDHSAVVPAQVTQHEGSNISDAVEIHDTRFIGDLNPEGVFIAARSPERARKPTSSNSIGIWFEESGNGYGKEINWPSSPRPPSIFFGSTSMAKQTLLPVLEKESLSTLPPPVHRDALCSAYFLKIHPIFPIIDEAAYREMPELCPARIILEQGICLVASMDFSMEPHLNLPDSAHPLDFVDFGRRLLAAMNTVLELGLVTEKLVLIQALALMSFFIESRGTRETSSLVIGKAVHYVFSLGLHIQDSHGDCDRGRKYAATLFCCIWVLDRLNAASHGLPVLMHERDIERSLKDCIDAQSPSFRLVLHVVQLLDRVIQLYRPRNKDDESSTEDFPLFEELILQCDAAQLPTYQLSKYLYVSCSKFQRLTLSRATIELLYHATAILSCRSSSCDIRLGSSAAQIRQNLSATRLTTMRGDEFRNQVVLLPFVPYAISLSLSVAYREMRRSKVPMYRARAQNDVKANCRSLDQLGEVFWTAKIMAQMGNATLKELDRVRSNVSDDQLRTCEQRPGGCAPTGNVSGYLLPCP